MARLGKQITVLVGWMKERSKPLLTILVIVSLLLLVWITWKTYKLDNLGFGVKTYWDWMELLVIPVVLALGAWFLNKSERENEREIADERRKQDKEIADERRNQATLEAYLDRMTELLLNEGLRESQESDEVRSIARTRTLAVVRSLDSHRKGQVVQFLYESGLIGPKQVVVLLNEANLNKALLYWADLSGANLNKVLLRGANLHKANLSGANLDASLRWADLSGANLYRANLSGANLSRADLTEADLTEADLTEADLNWANMTDAKVTDEQLAQAKSLKGATMPDGTKHE